VAPTVAEGDAAHKTRLILSENGQQSADARWHMSACTRQTREGLMKILIAFVVLSFALLAGAAHGEPNVSQQLDDDVRYEITQLPSLGGTSSAGFSINDRGWVTGRSNLPDNQTREATLWRNESLTRLGTLGGLNSVVRWPVKNTRGIITGISQTDKPDPLNEDWSCSAFFPVATGTGYQCLGFRWLNGEMTPLSTLGGTHGFAAGTNNAGRTVGWAENTVHDPTCVPPQVLQFRPVMWGPNGGRIQELPLLPGDTSGAATRSTTAARSSASPASATRRSGGSPRSTPCSGKTAR
jgi:hypothetical protein